MHFRNIIDINNIKIGDGSFVIIAGPCSVENREMLLETAKHVKAYGARILRGGAYKPRTSPHAFQGLKEEGLLYLKEVSNITGLPVVSEIMDIRDLENMYEYIDILQIGSRNMQNFSLLKEVGRCSKPILLKRGMASTIEEFLLAAEYITKEGNNNVILCERGIRTFENFTRNTLDLAAIPILKSLSKLPVIFDPSHGVGKREYVSAMTLAGLAAGADGVMLEVHPNPDMALSDGAQSLDFLQYEKLSKKISSISTYFEDIRRYSI